MGIEREAMKTWGGTRDGGMFNAVVLKMVGSHGDQNSQEKIITRQPPEKQSNDGAPPTFNHDTGYEDNEDLTARLAGMPPKGPRIDPMMTIQGADHLSIGAADL